MPFSAPQLQRRWKALPGEPVGDAGDAYTGYDRFGRVERMRWGKLGDGGSFSPLVDVSWGHSPSSQKTWRKDSLGPPVTAQDQKFDYDALYQLTQRQRGVLNVNLTSAGGVPAQQEDFAYDETGNWRGYGQQAGGASVIEQSRVNNQSNQITQVDGSSSGISYDKNGNMLTVPTGEALTDPSNRIVWDGWNRPVKVYDAADNLLAEYRYDGLGRRITVSSGGVTRHTYYDDQWRSIEERIDDSTTAERQHIWHPADRWEMILRDRSTANNGVMDERLYPLKDQLDPVAIADDTGTVLERFSYTAFGIPTFLDSSFNTQSPTHAWNFLFHAEFQDAETGWFNYGYRYYATMMGRWLSRDPIGERGGRNLYSALENNPVNSRDVLGLDDHEFMIVGTTVQAVGGADETDEQRSQRALANKIGIDHTDLYYGTRTKSALLIQGFTSRNKEFPAYDKDVTNLNVLKVLTRNTFGSIALQWGDYKGEKCDCVTDAMRVNCLLASPEPACKHQTGVNDCQTDLEHATRGCCLAGYTSLGTRTKRTPFEMIKTNYIKDADERQKQINQLQNRMNDPVQRMYVY